MDADAKIVHHLGTGHIIQVLLLAILAMPHVLMLSAALSQALQWRSALAEWHAAPLKIPGLIRSP